MFYSAQSNKVSSETKGYFLYARKSSDDEERQALSIPAQIDELKEFAHKENISLADILVESKTAKEPGREIFNSMLSRIGSGEAGGILAWHPDRLARNAVDAGQIIHLLDKGLLFDLKFPSFWFQNTSQGLFMLSLAFGQSKYYIDALSENTKRGLRQKVRRGEYPSHAPLGYLNDRVSKKVEVDEKEAILVKGMFQRYVQGSVTTQDLSNFLAQNGIKSKGGANLHISRISFILTNPFYLGLFRYNGEIYEGKHTPLISKKLFDQVQEIITGRNRHKVKEPRNLPFTGIFRCGECGMMITAELKTKFYKTTNRTVDYVYYRCTKKNKLHKCLQPYIRQEQLIERVNNLIKKFELPKGWGVGLLKRVARDERNETSIAGSSKQEVKEELNFLNQKIEKLLDAHLDNLIGREEYTKKKEGLVLQKKTLEDRLLVLSRNHLTWLEPLKNFVKTLSSVPQIVQDNLNLHPKKEFLKYLGSNFTLRDGKVEGKGGKEWAARSAAPTTRELERDTRIGLASPPWEGGILPLY